MLTKAFYGEYMEHLEQHINSWLRFSNVEVIEIKILFVEGAFHALVLYK